MFKHQDLQLFWSIVKQSNFQPLEGVSRGSETQLQGGENLNYLIERLWNQFLK